MEFLLLKGERCLLFEELLGDGDQRGDNWQERIVGVLTRDTVDGINKLLEDRLRR